MVSCGKRGSLLVAGPAIIVAANQPPAAAIASDEMKSDVDCIFPPDDFVRGEKLSPARQGDPGALEVTANGQGCAANLPLATHGNRQTVSIRPKAAAICGLSCSRWSGAKKHRARSRRYP